MISRKGRNAIVVVVLLYTSVLFMNLLLFQKCVKRHLENGKTFLEFNFHMGENGEKMTYLSALPSGQEVEIQRIDRTVQRKEVIVINNGEYGGTVLLHDEAAKIQSAKKAGKSSSGSFSIKDNSASNLVIHEEMPTARNGKESKNKKRYIFSLRYYEQLTMATKNFLSLASLATYTRRQLVMPFVNNSRFSGLRLGTSMSRYLEASKYNNSVDNSLYNGGKFNSLDKYFDVTHLNSQLKERGYTTIVPFKEFQSNCRKLDVVIHFLYDDDFPRKNIEKWYKLPPSKSSEIVEKAKLHHGYTECNFVKRSKITKMLGNVNVSRYVCVDPEIMKSPQKLEEIVLKDAQCVGIILWKGNGTKRTHFPLAPNVSEPIRPSHLKHNRRLIDIAYQYIRDTIKRPFISVHVRCERHLTWRGVKTALNCIRKLNKKVYQRKVTFNLKKVFLATDLEDYGSDTLISNSNSQDRNILQTDLSKGLEKPFRFNPKDYGLYDRGEIAIVEMHILSLGESLFTLGMGNFQEWIMELFLLHNAEDKSLIYKVCTQLK